MATVYKETFTKPLPQGAEMFTRKGERFARWTDGRDKVQTARVTVPKEGTHAGQTRIVQEARTYTAKYRDGTGVVCKVSTGCRDEAAARNVLAQLVKRAEHVRGGIVTVAQDAVIDHHGTPLSGHLTAYLAHLSAKGVTAGRIKTTCQRFNAVAAGCKCERLGDLNGAALEHWLAEKAAAGMSAGSRNGYREACVGFGNWCRRTRRLMDNPFALVPKADAKADCRRHRRALTEAELIALLDVTRRRPLAEIGRESQAKADAVKSGKRRNTWTKAPLTLANMEAAEGRARMILDGKPGLVARLESLGRERALIYKALVLTGLRKGELASLTIGQLDLEGPTPSALLHAADEKNRQGSQIQLRADLAADLRAWLADKLAQAQADALRRGEPAPDRLPADMHLFRVPAQLVRILDRDLVMAGIARLVKDPKTGKTRIDKRDGRGAGRAAFASAWE